MSRRAAVVNGQLFPDGNGTVSVWDRGLLLGDGLFETMRAYGGKVLALDEHLERLEQGAGVLGIGPLAPRADRVREVHEAAAAAGGGELAVRLLLTRGSVAGASSSGAGRPTRAVLAEPFQPLPAALYVRGAAAITREAAGPGSAIKSTSYLRSLLASREAAAAGAHEAIWVAGGQVREGASSNVFLFTDGQLVTPPDDGAILAGITRRLLLQLSSSLGIQCVERPVAVGEIHGASEAFICSSLREIVPLVEVDGAAIGPGMPGSVTRTLHASLRAYAGARGAEPWR
jgi:branched-chain amino acid aminotransferase